MKYLLVGLTSTDEIKKVLNECIDCSQYKNDHKALAHKLSRLYPLSGWTERSLGYMLRNVEDGGSQSTDTAKINQIMEFLYPDEKFELTSDNLYEKIDDMYARLAAVRLDLSNAMRNKVIDEKESGLLVAQFRMLSQLIDKFCESAVKLVNVPLG